MKRIIIILSTSLLCLTPSISSANYRYTQREMEYSVRNALIKYYKTGSVECRPSKNPNYFKLHRRYHNWVCKWLASSSSNGLINCKGIWRITGSHKKNRYYAVESNVSGKGCLHRKIDEFI